MFSHQKRRLRGDPIALCSSLKGGCSEVGVGLFCHISGERMRGNGLTLCQRRVRLNIRKNKITGRVLWYWIKLSRDVVESLSLKVLKSHLDVALRNTV